MNAAGYKKSPRGWGGHGANGNGRTIKFTDYLKKLGY